MRKLELITQAQANADYERLMETMPPEVYDPLKKRIQRDRENILMEIEQSQLTEKNSRQEREWVDWLDHRKIEPRHYDEKQKHEYLKGVLERVTVSLNDDNKHVLEICFRMRWWRLLQKGKKRETVAVNGTQVLALDPVDMRSKVEDQRVQEKKLRSLKQKELKYNDDKAPLSLNNLTYIAQRERHVE